MQTHTRYMCISAYTAARHKEIERLINNSLKEIEEKNEILRGFKRLSGENRIDQVLSRCEKLRWYEEDERYDYVQQELNVTFNMRDENVRYKELGDVLFYYLLRDEEPVREIQELIIKMREKYISGIGWYSICSDILGKGDIVFTQFYKRLGNKPQRLEYLLYKQPQLLFNEYSLNHLIGRLNEHLPHNTLHNILLYTRDEDKQTCMFNTGSSLSLLTTTCVYMNEFDDLCELLSVQNKSGSTALHVNRNVVADLLFTHLTLNDHYEVNKLLSIRDNYNQTVYDTADDRYKKQVTWLTAQCARNNYPLYNPARVLILYNTDDRPGAKEEAYSIQRAFKSVESSIELKKMGTEHQILQLIAQQAVSWGTSVLIVCLMSHGNIGTIDDWKGNPITLTSIERAMCSDLLKKRPKILITQSCQTRTGGRKRTHEEATSSNTDAGPPRDYFVPNMPYVPVADHFLSVQSCSSGQSSMRNVFVPYLAEEIIKSSENDGFSDLVTKVIRKMQSEKNNQIPIMKTTLGGKVCLKDQWRRLTCSTNQYEHNTYLLYYPPRVLILYNTNDREGAEREAESIQQAFESVIHNSDRIEMKEMGTKDEVLELIALKAKVADSMLIVCLMSHGNIGTIDDSENNPITLTSIEIAMCSEQLKERPKILITQSCQTRAGEITYTDKGKRKRKGGKKRKREVEDKLVKKRKLAKTTHDSLRGTTSQSSADAGKYRVSNSPYEPKNDDFLSVQTCISGKESIRNVFIPYLAEEIIKSSKTDNFAELVSNASNKMRRDAYEQIPIVKSTLRGKVCVKDHRQDL